MINNNLRQGFTLVQLMIMLLIISVVLAASAPMITRAHKKIPERAIHGKYFCYYDNDGKLREEYYDSRRLVKGGEVSECVFKPNNRVATYTIELIGGGAGGSYYYKISEALEPKITGELKTIADPTNTRSGTVISTNKSYDDKLTISPLNAKLLYPNASMLRNIFNGNTLTYCSRTGTGQKGGNLLVYNYKACLTQCGILDSSGINLIETWSEYPSIISQKYGDAIVISGAPDLEPICKGSVSEATQEDYTNLGGKPEYNVQTAYETVRVEGKEGSPEKKLKYDYKISIPNNLTTVSEVLSYLNKITKNLRAGYCTDAGCSDFVAKDQPDPDSSKKTETEIDRGNNNTLDDYYFFKAPSGADGYYATIRKEDGTFLIAPKAKGGHGASEYLDLNEHVFVYNKDAVNGNDLQDQPELVHENLVSSCSSSGLKAYKIEQQFNKRTHEYGVAGRAGTYKTASVSSLGTSCTIKPGKGGAAGTEDSNFGKAGGNTTIDCGQGVYIGTALGGIAHTAMTYKSSNSFSMVDYLDGFFAQSNPDLKNAESYIKEKKPAFVTDLAKDGASSGYTISSNIFAKYGQLPTIKFGFGGAGTLIEDKAIHLWGKWEHKWGNSAIAGYGRFNKSEQQATYYGKLNESSTLKITKPKNGQNGAVIITW